MPLQGNGMAAILKRNLKLGQTETNNQVEARTKSQQNFMELCKINPEGTCGPIRPENSASSLSPSWLHFCIKKLSICEFQNLTYSSTLCHRRKSKQLSFYQLHDSKS